MRKLAFLLIAISAFCPPLFAQTADNSSITLTWPLDKGTGNESATVAPETFAEPFITSTSMSYGSELTVKCESSNGSSPIAHTYDGYTQTFFMQGSKTSSATDKNAIDFSINLAPGITFTPTRIGLKVARWLTDKCKIEVSWIDEDGAKTVLASGITPNRNYNPDKGTGDKTISILDYDVYGAKANEGSCGIRVNVYGMNSGKTVSIGDVYVEGILNGTVGQAITFILNTHVDPADAGVVTVSPQADAYAKGSRVELAQTPADGYFFKGWYIAGDKCIGTSSTMQIVMDGNMDITARYATRADMLRNDYYIVDDITSFRQAIKEVNSYNDGQRRFIFLKDGIYDYGTFVSSEAEVNRHCGRDTIFADNVSIIGQSTNGTIIQIEPTMASVSRTAPIVIMGTGTYLQDLTLSNNFSYSGNDGQAAALMDLGHHTIGKNVLLLSKQDTYYPNTDYGQLYWETSEFHGTVDFICGRGDVYFNGCRLKADQRYANAYSGDTHIAAPYTIGENFDDRGGHGFIFQNCYIDCKAKTFDYGRGWRGYPRMAYLNTTLSPDAAQRIGVDMSTGKAPDNTARFTTKGIQSSELPAQGFYEYNTMDEAGNVISPASNILTFTASGSLTYETILSDAEAARYDLRAVYPDWLPDIECRQTALEEVTIDGSTLSWTCEGEAKAFLIELDGAFVDIVDGTVYSYTTSMLKDGTYTVRAANINGGFGPATKAVIKSGILSVAADPATDVPLYDINGRPASAGTTGILVGRGTKILKK